MTEIGFLGAGQLGEPMVLRLIAAGHPVLVFARRGDVRARLRAEGAVLAESVADLAARSDILICCLFSDVQLREIGLGPDGFVANAKPGAIFVSHTTGAPATLVELSQRAVTPLTILDAPVSGTADDIAQGKLTVLIGGPARLIERVRPVLAAYADPIVPTGNLGSALAAKLVNNMLFAANAQLVAAAAATAEQFGVDSTTLLQALSVSSGGSYAAGSVAGIGLDAFIDLAGPFLRKDAAAAVAAADVAGIDLGLLRSVIEAGPLNLTENRTDARTGAVRWFPEVP